MGKAALIAVAAFALLGVMQTFQTQRGSSDATHRVANHQHEVVARSAALAGYRLARQRLADTFTTTSVSGNYDEATYAVSVSISGNRAEIESIGTSLDAAGEPVQVKVLAEFEKDEDALSEDTPVFMQYALISDENLNMNGNILGEILVQGDERATLNANMHTNQNMHIDGNSVSVEGFGTFVGSGTSNPGKALQNAFSPNYNPTGQDGAHQSAEIEIPNFDIDLFTSRVAVDSTVLGNLMLLGSYDFGGTRENPYVLHIDGDLTATGSTTFSGYTLFLVEGNVVFNGNVEVGDTGYSGSDESSIGFYAEGNIEMGGNTSVYGQMFSGGDLVFMHGTPRIYGSLTTKGAADLRGTPKIYYRQASPGLTQIWEDPTETVLVLDAYSEW